MVEAESRFASTKPLRISVIVCAYTERRWDDLVSNVQALQTQTRLPDQIVVVIDHNPALLERTQREISGIVVVDNTRARGLSGARNSGLAVVTGDVVAFIDEDAIPSPKWIELLLSQFTDDSIAGVGGAIRPMWLAGRPKWFPNEFDWVVGCTYEGMPTSPTRVRNLIGCNMAFRRQVFTEIGGFTNGIGRVGTRPVGCEETELCIRLNQHDASAKLMYLPEAYVEHRVPAARGTLRYFIDRCYSEGLSKALIVLYVGQNDGLSSERTYTTRTLPLGVAHNLMSVAKLDVAGLPRAGAIMLGLSTTVFGYLIGRFKLMRLSRNSSTNQPSTV